MYCSRMNKYHKLALNTFQKISALCIVLQRRLLICQHEAVVRRRKTQDRSTQLSTENIKQLHVNIFSF